MFHELFFKLLNLFKTKLVTQISYFLGLGFPANKNFREKMRKLRKFSFVIPKLFRKISHFLAKMNLYIKRKNDAKTIFAKTINCAKILWNSLLWEIKQIKAKFREKYEIFALRFPFFAGNPNHDKVITRKQWNMKMQNNNT